MDKNRAEALFNQLADALNNAERTIIEIIKTKAWEPLGYATFAEAWDDRLAGIRLATGAMRAHVVYALLEDGLTAEQASATSGVGIGNVDFFDEQRRDGVPPHLASYHRVRSHARSNPSEPRVLRLTFSAEELDRLKSRAKGEGWDLEDEARKAVRAHFAKMMKVAS